MNYTQGQLTEAQETRTRLIHAFRSVTLGHTRSGDFHSKTYNEKVKDLEHIKTLVHLSTYVDKDVIEKYFQEANDLETHNDIWQENPLPRTISDGFMHYVSDEKMCEIMGFVPSQKQTVLSALRFW